jgi:hypothetical protein
MSEQIINKLKKYIDSGDLDGAIGWLGSIDKTEQKLLSKLLIKEFKKRNEDYYDWGTESGIRENLKVQIDVLSTMIYVTSSLTDIKRVGWSAIPNIETLKNIWLVFKPKWIDEWVNWVLDENPRQFKLVHPLYLAGLCQKPTHENYILGMIETVGYNPKVRGNLLECIKAVPDILQDDIWRIFEIEGGGEFSLSAKDKYSHVDNTWAKTLKQLCEEGILSRDRLLDSSLDALTKDFSQFRAGWFSRFFTSLAPSIEEIAARNSYLILLLGSQIPPTVSFALKNLHSLEKKKLIDASAFLSNVEPTLNAKTKSTVILSLRILDSLAKRNDGMSNEISLVSINAIYFDNADVQNKVFDLVDKYGNKGDIDIIEALQQCRDFVVPSLKTRIMSWIPNDEIESFEFDEPYHAPTLEPERTTCVEIIPIAGLEELIRELSHLIEEPNDPIKIERVLDGLSRIGRRYPENFLKLVGPLMKRATVLESRGEEKWLTYYLSKLALSYIEKENRFKAIFSAISRQSEASFENVFITRLYFLVESILRKQSAECSLISMPTHGQGFVNPKILPERIRMLLEAKEPSSSIDEALTILRIDKAILTKSETLVVVDSLVSISTEFALACAYALGAKVEVGRTKSLWVAAACINTPSEVDDQIIKKYGTLGPDAGRPTSYKPWVKVKKSDNYTFYDLKVDKEPQAPSTIPLDQLSVLFHREKAGYYDRIHFGNSEGLVKWGSTIWPSNLEPYFCCGACEVDISWAEAQWHVQSFFLPLLNSSVPLKPMALLLIIAGLSSKEPGQKGIAAEVVIMSIDDGRLDIKSLGDQMASLITTGLIIVSRWSKIFKEIAAISSRHAEAMRILIQSLLRFDPENSPRELGGLIELLFELNVATGKSIDDERAIEFLKTNSKGGKQGKFSKRLLALA